MHAAFGDDDDKIRCIGAVLCALTHAITERGVPPPQRTGTFLVNPEQENIRALGREGEGRRNQTKPIKSSKERPTARGRVICALVDVS